MKKINVAINGFGRIGRAFFRLASLRPEINIVALNDLAEQKVARYLLEYDTVYGHGGFSTSYNEEGKWPRLIINDKPIFFFNEKDPKKLPWKSLEVDIVVEATGVFASYAASQVHLDAGAKRVVVTAPVKDEPAPGISGSTVLMGVNEDKLKVCDISSNASCTTNAGSPVIAILEEALGIQKAMLNTIHGYTASQSLVDSPNKKDLRRGRAAAQNIIPSTTGAANATTKAIKALSDKFDGIAIRVPVVAGSIVDITFLSKKDTSVEEVNSILETASREERWSKVFSVTKEPIVSSDIIGSPFASIADLSFTRVVDGDLVKVLAWYDNEMGYANALTEHVIKSGYYAVEGRK
ncbi:MAG: glyceraldehyde 3-phosphate dehydrogenase NAD-binding domain-containing protein [Candidatus Paceibacterota bacterium]